MLMCNTEIIHMHLAPTGIGAREYDLRTFLNYVIFFFSGI
jgi:hypothetical protein